MPRRLQIDFSQVIQEMTDSSGKEIHAAEIFAAFRTTYLDAPVGFGYLHHEVLANVEGSAPDTEVAVKVDHVPELRLILHRQGPAVPGQPSQPNQPSQQGAIIRSVGAGVDGVAAALSALGVSIPIV